MVYGILYKELIYEYFGVSEGEERKEIRKLI